MKYVTRAPSGAFELVQYEDYLERQAGTLAARVHGAPLLQIDRFIPSGPGSFHDSRFKALSVTQSALGGADPKVHSRTIELHLNGPYFDRRFELRYEGVISCIFQLPAPEDDLLMHELSEERGLVTHELQFDQGRSLVIICGELHFGEVLDAPE